MKDYVKCLTTITLPNSTRAVWVKGEYYKILKESNKYIWPTNEILKLLEENSIEDNTFISIEEILDNVMALQKPDGKRVPLGFIRLTYEEVEKEIAQLF